MSMPGFDLNQSQQQMAAMPGPQPGLAKQDPPLQSTTSALHRLAEIIEGQLGDLRGKLAPILNQQVNDQPSQAPNTPYNIGSSEVAQSLYQLHNKLEGISTLIQTIYFELEV